MLDIFNDIPGSKIMPDADFSEMFFRARIEWRKDHGNLVQWRPRGEGVWRNGGMRSHYRVGRDGVPCAKYDSAARAMFFCLMLEQGDA